MLFLIDKAKILEIYTDTTNIYYKRRILKSSAEFFTFVLMDDVSPLVNYVTKQMPLTKAEEDFLASLLRAKKVRRKQFLDQPGFVSRYRNYVVKGALRTYIIGDDGPRINREVIQSRPVPAGPGDKFIIPYFQQ
ncbi:hypothetical protein Mucpa_5406 [Mucilaginibacter paludis DSM 18603]|uniref:Uncharacterized protein n=1 Tax=Mucilaginibacter paludis DSM 18603 TaxID=714943 RepID=H1Y9A0_9SPHI|nr:hypothetical protein Mucpa_5406 [Mucilaginibacter paludis DSM 18603]